MKRLALLTAVLMAGLCAGQSTDLDRASAELAASLVLRDLREELRAKPADPAALRDAMLADPAANADPATAEHNMALAHSNALARAFAGEARALLDRLAAPAPRTPGVPSPAPSWPHPTALREGGAEAQLRLDLPIRPAREEKTPETPINTGFSAPAGSKGL